MKGKEELAIRTIVTLLAVFCVSQANADIAAGLPDFNWTQPTTWSDGAPLTTAQITGYQLNCTGVVAVNRRIAAVAGCGKYLDGNRIC